VNREAVESRATQPRDAKDIAAPREGVDGLIDLYLAFMQISLSGFGGAINWAHRALVQQRRWMNDEDFTETLSLCQFLPGPNIVNFAMCLGQRQHGLSGALAALAGVFSVPLFIFILLGFLYSEFGQIAFIHGFLAGISAAAAGFIITIGVRLAQPHRRRPLSMLFGLAAFVGVGMLRFPLLEVMLVLAPLSVAIARWRQP
jgi:chromate transporter